jgi:hypothetical protein
MKVGKTVEEGYSHSRRDETATPLCGAHRNKGTNPLLIKPQLGSVKASTFALPPDFNHTYGLEQVRDGLTSEMVVGTWAQHDGTKGMVPARDFKALNKAAIVDGSIDTRDIAEYRKTHDIRLKLGSDKKAEKKPFDENTTFGRPTRPSTPFGDLVSHGFRYDWVMQSEPAESAVQRSKPKKPAPTKSSIGHAAASKEKLADCSQESTWKMKQFASVSAKIGKQG